MSRNRLHLLLAMGAAAVMLSVPPEARALSCTAGPFMVFFDPDKDDITAAAQSILDYVVPAHSDCGLQNSRVVIDGHADRAGSEAHNLALSRRRARRVADYLRAKGLPEALPTTAALGESRPLKDTPDGVREPENRRVEIIFAPWWPR
jgi:outer membrane protein OmpA-like peptidoglycan-associated protein